MRMVVSNGIEVLDARKLLPAEFLARFANRNAKPS
jgi:hypothetical protein